MFILFSKKYGYESSLVVENKFDHFESARLAAIEIFNGNFYGSYIGNEEGNIIYALDGKGCRNF